jgi:predicted amidohydrolase YtcJ
MAHRPPGNGEPNDTQLARANALGVGWALTFSSVRNGATGPRYRTVMESGAHMCLATDAMNVAPWAPFQSLWYVTTGDTLLPGVPGVPADQRLTREEALRHATVECAWFLDLDGKLGTLEPGMLADLIVLTDDYFTVPDNEIKDLKSLLTVVDGRIVYAEGPYAGLD